MSNWYDDGWDDLIPLWGSIKSIARTANDEDGFGWDNALDLGLNLGGDALTLLTLGTGSAASAALKGAGKGAVKRSIKQAAKSTVKNTASKVKNASLQLITKPNVSNVINKTIGLAAVEKGMSKDAFKNAVIKSLDTKVYKRLGDKGIDTLIATLKHLKFGTSSKKAFQESLENIVAQANKASKIYGRQLGTKLLALLGVTKGASYLMRLKMNAPLAPGVDKNGIIIDADAYNLYLELMADNIDELEELETPQFKMGGHIKYFY